VSGASNTAIGADALTANSASSNTAVGYQSLYTITTAPQNTALGYQAGYNATNVEATYVGYRAGYGVTTAASGTAVGRLALGGNSAGVTGANNVAVGNAAMYVVTSGVDNVAVGTLSLFDNTTGSSNTALGRSALRSNTTASSNTAVGYQAGYYQTTAQYNTFVGGNAALGVSGSGLTGNFNTALGYEAGVKLQTTAQQNTFVGAYAGYYNGSTSTANGITTGINNTCVGYAAYPSSATVNDEFTLGNAGVTNLRCNDTTISSLSDERDKTNIVDIPLGLDFINTLRPVAFDWNRRDGSYVGKKDFGFIAQELKVAQDATEYADHMRLVHQGTIHVDDVEHESLEADPMKTYPILIKAIQELSAKNEELEARLAALESA